MRCVLKICLLASLALLSGAQGATISGLNWNLDNAATASDIRLEWSGAGMIPRTEHTAIWRYNPRQQTGYYSVAWHSSTGAWDNGAYAYGTHPFPADDCTTDADGVSATANSGSSVHCWEEAGMGLARDYLLSPAAAPGTGTTVVKSVWYTQVRRVHLATTGTCNGKYQHDFYYDYANNPSTVITYCMPTADLGSPTSPRFYFGGSLWQANSPSSGKNDETLAGKLRCVELYDAALSDADVATEAATCTNSASSSEGITHLWYANANPTVADVTDKSGAGHDPSWATANRPTDWDSTYGGGPPSGTLLRGVGK